MRIRKRRIKEENVKTLRCSFVRQESELSKIKQFEK